MLGKMPGMKNLAMARQLKKQVGSGMAGMPGMGMPGMGMPGMGFPGFGMPGMGMPGAGPSPTDGMTKMRTLSAAERNAKKAQRKREKDARRKSRR